MILYLDLPISIFLKRLYEFPYSAPLDDFHEGNPRSVDVWLESRQDLVWLKDTIGLGFVPIVVPF